jgi:hypothetical protein
VTVPAAVSSWLLLRRDFETEAATRPTMPEPSCILAGDCTVTDEASAARGAAGSRAKPGDADENRRERGNVVALCKPDNCRELAGTSRPAEFI